MFPLEIFEEILRHCDPVDLLRFRSVCSAWNEMIPRILDAEAGLWYKKCMKDIPENMQHSIFSEMWEPRTSKVWMGHWRSWIGWQNALHMEWTALKLEPLSQGSSSNDRITRIAVADTIIAIASLEGNITVSNMKEKIVQHFYMENPIADLKITEADDRFVISILLINGTKFLCDSSMPMEDLGRNLQRERHTVITGFGPNLTLPRANMYVRATSAPVSRIRILETTCPFDMEIYPQIYESVVVLPEVMNIVAIGTNGRHLLLWGDKNRHFRKNFVSELEDDWECISVSEPRVPIRCYRIFKPLVTACIGELGEFGFSVNGQPWRMYDLFSKLHARVTAILFHVGVLVLGLETGVLHIFAVRNVDELLDLNFDEIQSKKFTLKSGPITHLHATECNSVPCIVAADTRTVFLISIVFA